ncbi:MAG: biotin carboxylase [Planctomycetota bacterium]|nr:biotin carboxylase [Planctomycetota bacterium]
MTQKRTLKGISDIRRYFHRNETPIYFVSATHFNLLGIDEWVRNFRHINYIDCCDGQQPNTFVPSRTPHEPFDSMEDIVAHLLHHKEVVDYIRRRARERDREDAGRAVFLMFDERAEKAAQELGLKVWFPSAQLRQRVDNKVETVRIGDKAGVPSVPNVLAPVKSWEDLKSASQDLGDSLVVQTAFGDSGHTTFFIDNEQDYAKHAEEIAAEPEVKIMRRIRCRGSAIEACTTKQGTIVGPLMTELVGFSELTPYRGGWCGNEIFAEAFTPAIRQQAVDYTFKFGEQLRKEGYRGYFELDFLIDLDREELYLGELNPRITGASSITNHAAFAHADMPLFLFHLLEFSDVDFEFDIQDLNSRWADPDNIDEWSQLVIKWTSEDVVQFTDAPPTGIWHMAADGSVAHRRFDYHRRAVETEAEGFWLRISAAGDFGYEGADLGILVTRGRLMTDDFELTPRARGWIDGLRAHFVSQPVGSAPVEAEVTSGGFKIL